VNCETWARGSIVALVLSFGALELRPALSFAQPAPVATKAPSSNCALATLPEDRVTFQDSFSHTIVDVPTLRFFALIFHAAPDVQRKMFALAAEMTGCEAVAGSYLFDVQFNSK
jgi:hypothetical protein